MTDFTAINDELEAEDSSLATSRSMADQSDVCKSTANDVSTLAPRMSEIEEELKHLKQQLEEAMTGMDALRREPLVDVSPREIFNAQRRASTTSDRKRDDKDNISGSTASDVQQDGREMTASRNGSPVNDVDRSSEDGHSGDDKQQRGFGKQTGVDDELDDSNRRRSKSSDSEGAERGEVEKGASVASSGSGRGESSGEESGADEESYGNVSNTPPLSPSSGTTLTPPLSPTPIAPRSDISNTNTERSDEETDTAETRSNAEGEASDSRGEADSTESGDEERSQNGSSDGYSTAHERSGGTPRPHEESASGKSKQPGSASETGSASGSEESGVDGDGNGSGSETEEEPDDGADTPGPDETENRDRDDMSASGRLATRSDQGGDDSSEASDASTEEASDNVTLQRSDDARSSASESDGRQSAGEDSGSSRSEASSRRSRRSSRGDETSINTAKRKA